MKKKTHERALSFQLMPCYVRVEVFCSLAKKNQLRQMYYLPLKYHNTTPSTAVLTPSSY